MFTISNNGMITMNRGETASFPLFIDHGVPGKPVRYDLKYHKGAIVYLGVMECNTSWEQSIIKKKYNYTSPMTRDGDIIVEFESRDTEYLRPGKYYYEVKLHDEENDKVETVISRKEFFIVE